jgi:hypothetical protein
MRTPGAAIADDFERDRLVGVARRHPLTVWAIVVGLVFVLKVHIVTGGNSSLALAVIATAGAAETIAGLGVIMAPALVVIGAVALWYAYFAFAGGVLLQLAVVASLVAVIIAPDYLVGICIVVAIPLAIMHRRGWRFDMRERLWSMGLAAGTIVFSAVTGQGMWLPPEVVTFSDDSSTVAYVLDDDGPWTTLLIDGDRTIQTIRSETITGRQVCSLHAGTRRTLLDWLPGPAKPSTQICPEAPDAPA